MSGVIAEVHLGELEIGRGYRRPGGDVMAEPPDCLGAVAGVENSRTDHHGDQDEADPDPQPRVAPATGAAPGRRRRVESGLGALVISGTRTDSVRKGHGVHCAQVGRSLHHPVHSNVDDH